MTDIVERLRALDAWALHDATEVMHEGADEIDRLREALRLADAALSGANMNMNVVEKKIRIALGRVT